MQRFSPLLATSEEDQETDDYAPKKTPFPHRNRKQTSNHDGRKRSAKLYKNHLVRRNVSPADRDLGDIPKKYTESESEPESESYISEVSQNIRGRPTKAREVQEFPENSDQESWSAASVRRKNTRKQHHIKQTNKEMHAETVSDCENEEILAKKSLTSKESKSSVPPDSAESSDYSVSDLEDMTMSKKTNNPVQNFENGPHLEEDTSMDSSNSEQTDEQVENILSELGKRRDEKIRKNLQGNHSHIYSSSLESDEDEQNQHEKHIKRTSKRRRQALVDSDLLWPSSDSSARLRGNKKGRRKQEPIECKVCGRNIRCKAIMERHMLTHTGEKPFKCSDCGRCYTSSSNLRIHQLTHSGKMDYSCEECGQKFTHLPYLKRHLLRHSGTKQHICEQCGKGFIQKYHLERHLRVHTGKMPYSCDKCDASFNRTDYLSLHMRNVHLGESCDDSNKAKPKMYKCDTCAKVLTSRASLEAHERVHTGVMPFSCTICQRKFKQSSQVHAHMRTHTGERPYMCDVCGHKFTRKSYVKLHKERKHGTKPNSKPSC